MDRVIGISGTTTDRIEYQLKEPNEDEFASLNIQHLNQNGTNELIGESKYPTHNVDSRNQMINEKIREYIDQRPVIVIDEEMLEDGTGGFEIDEEIKTDYTIYKFFGFFDPSQYASNNAKLDQLKKCDSKILIITTMMGARGVDFKCNVQAFVICAFFPKLYCEVVQALARGSRVAEEVCEGYLILEERVDLINGASERMSVL